MKTKLILATLAVMCLLTQPVRAENSVAAPAAKTDASQFDKIDADMGVERKTAAEFSFFLAIPTMVGATTYDLWKNHSTLSANDMMTILIGFITAFIVAWFVIRWFIGFVSTKDFMPFAWYRIIFGIIILVWLHYSLPG